MFAVVMLSQTEQSWSGFFFFEKPYEQMNEVDGWAYTQRN